MLMKYVSAVISAAFLLIGVIYSAIIVSKRGYTPGVEHEMALLFLGLGCLGKSVSPFSVTKLIARISCIGLLLLCAWTWFYILILHNHSFDFAIFTFESGAAVWLVSFFLIRYTTKNVLRHLLWLGIGIGVNAVVRFSGFGFSGRNGDLYTANLVWTCMGIAILIRALTVELRDNQPKIN